jgi:hypothetical protein
MFQIATVSPDQATGKVAELYAAFPKEWGIPEPAKLLSASPGYMERYFATMGYFRSHPNLSAPLLASIRYAVAAKADHVACVDWNGCVLNKMGASAADLEALRAGADKTILDERENAMLRFVLKAVDNPASVGPQDLDALRGLNYADSDIFDALAHAGNMVAGTLIYKTFSR